MELLELEAGLELEELDGFLELEELEDFLDELLEGLFDELDETDEITDELLNFELVVVPASQAIILNANKNARIEIINSFILPFKTIYLLIEPIILYKQTNFNTIFKKNLFYQFDKIVKICKI